MSDISAQLRRASEVYSDSYPPDIFNGADDPSITTLAPSTVLASAGPTTITVTGTNFEAGSVVEVNQAAQPTTFVSATSLTISYDPTVAGTVMFTVRNPNEEESNSVAFVVGAGAEEEPVPEEEEPEPTSPYESSSLDEQVATWTVEEVKSFVTANPEQRYAVLDAERQGRARSTLIAWLESEG